MDQLTVKARTNLELTKKTDNILKACNDAMNSILCSVHFFSFCVVKMVVTVIFFFFSNKKMNELSENSDLVSCSTTYGKTPYLFGMLYQDYSMYSEISFSSHYRIVNLLQFIV